MVAEVSIAMRSPDSSFVVPKTAVVHSTEKIFVVRVTGDKAERVTVKKEDRQVMPLKYSETFMRATSCLQRQTKK